jgi:glutamyl-tRNA reductase
MLMIDIAVPRDIEAQVGELSDVYLYTVDDLREIVDQNIDNRKGEARKADIIIDQGVLSYTEQVRSLQIVDTVKEYRQLAEQQRDQEMQRALRALNRGDDPQQVVVALARGITNKLIHAPTAGLKQASAAGRLDVLAGARRLLGLDAANETSTISTRFEQDEPPADDSAAITKPMDTTLQ